jgi:hypothetical protein
MTLDPRYRAIISNIANAVPMTSRRDNLPLGTHEVAICRYQPRLGQMNTGYRLEATFLILSSDQPSISPSTIRDWAWFPESAGIRGQFEADRARTFLSLGREGLGVQESEDSVGDKLATGEYRGLRWRVTVTQVLDDHGQALMTRPKGRGKSKPIRNAEWSPVQQTIADLAQMRAYIEQNFASACKNIESYPQQVPYGQQYAPHPVQMAPAQMPPAQMPQYSGQVSGLHPSQFVAPPSGQFQGPPFAQFAPAPPQPSQQFMPSLGQPVAPGPSTPNPTQAPWAPSQAALPPRFVPSGPPAQPYAPPAQPPPPLGPQVTPAQQFVQQYASPAQLPPPAGPQIAALAPLMNTLRQQ